MVIVVEHRGERREVTPGAARMTVGRGAHNDIVIGDLKLSRLQCTLTLGEEGIFVQDSGSTCGTFVDGRSAVGQTRLHVGAKIYFGDTVLTIVSR